MTCVIVRQIIMLTTKKIALGIDPGWKNMGIALLEHNKENKVDVIATTVLAPASYESIWDIRFHLRDWFDASGVHPADIDCVGIERFVSYNNVDSAESEHILLTIGATAGYLASACRNPEIALYRAFEWKVNLNKHLVKNKGFSNPSTSFDKKFSIAAAKACLDYDYEFKTDHEGDACAIAYYTMVQSES